MIIFSTTFHINSPRIIHKPRETIIIFNSNIVRLCLHVYVWRYQAICTSLMGFYIGGETHLDGFRNPFLFFETYFFMRD